MIKIVRISILTFIVVLGLNGICYASENRILVKGTVSDFNGNPIDGATVHFQDENFNPLYSTITGSRGKFSVEIENRKYKAVFAVKDYAINYLEFWHWDYKPKPGDNLDIKIDGLELYGMKVWTTFPTYPGLIVYVRPMSLKRWLAAGKPKGVAAIAPDLIKGDVTATVNGKRIIVRGLNKVKEYVNEEEALDAYLVHIDPAGSKVEQGDTLCLILEDRVTSELGKGCIDIL